MTLCFSEPPAAKTRKVLGILPGIGEPLWRSQLTLLLDIASPMALASDGRLSPGLRVCAVPQGASEPSPTRGGCVHWLGFMVIKVGLIVRRIVIKQEKDLGTGLHREMLG